jgi:hypothetical protein
MAGVPETTVATDALQPPPSRDAELVFVAGPRAGERLPIEGRSVALDREGYESADGGASSVVATFWTQGEHIMLRNGGAITVGGARPTLPIVVLEDGDELAWSTHRAEFRRLPPVGR